MSDNKAAVLLLAHGTPEEVSDIPKYLSNVVSGRPMPQHVIDEITHRYGLIGKSPLTTLTLEQGRLLEQALGGSTPVYVGMRNWRPYISDVVRQMRSDGITEAVAICLAPQNSRTSVGLYRRAVLAEAGDQIRVEFVEGWADHPDLAEAFADRLRPVLASVEAETGDQPTVLFTAHSVPCRTIQTPAAPGNPNASPDTWVLSSAQIAQEGRGSALENGVILSEAKDLRLPSQGSGPNAQPRPTLGPDPYATDSKHTAQSVAERLGLGENRWVFAFQSQGMAGGPWIGPAVEDTLTALHAAGVRTVVLQTIGFLCDHVEILYDVDIAFKEFARNLGMRLERPASLNDSPLLTRALVDLARGGLSRLEASRPALAAQ